MTSFVLHFLLPVGSEVRSAKLVGKLFCIASLGLGNLKLKWWKAKRPSVPQTSSAAHWLILLDMLTASSVVGTSLSVSDLIWSKTRQRCVAAVDGWLLDIWAGCHTEAATQQLSPKAISLSSSLAQTFLMYIALGLSMSEPVWTHQNEKCTWVVSRWV